MLIINPIPFLIFIILISLYFFSTFYMQRIQQMIREGNQSLSMLKLQGIKLLGLPSQCSKIHQQTFRLNQSLLKLMISYLFGRASKIEKTGLRWTVITDNDKVTNEKINGFDILFFQKNQVWLWMRLDKKETVTSLSSKLSKVNNHPQIQQYIWKATDDLNNFLMRIVQFGNQCDLKKEFNFINQEYLCKSLKNLKLKLFNDLKQCFIQQANDHLQYLENQEDFLSKARQIIKNMSDSIPPGLSQYFRLLEQSKISGGNEDNDDDENDNLDMNHPVTILNQHSEYIRMWKNVHPSFKNIDYSDLKVQQDWKSYVNQRKINQLKSNQIWGKLPKKITQGIINYIQTNDQNFLNNLITQQQKLNKWIILTKLERLKAGILSYSHQQIQRLGSQYMKQQKIDKILGQHQISIKFPVQTNIMKRLFDILGSFKDDKKLQAQFKNICQKFKFDYQKLKKTVNSQFQWPKIQKPQQDQLGDYQNEQMNQSQSLNNINQDKNLQNYSIQQIIRQIKIIQFNQQNYNYTIRQQSQNEQIKKFCIQTDKQFTSLSTEYPQKAIQIWTKKNVNNWAKNTRKINNMKLQTFVAILDRANQLITTNRLRNTQKISLWFFLQKDKTLGQIGQIKTGQGKTTIISFLAAIKCFHGYQVDIITSNNVLAQQGANERKQFYKLLGLTADNNNPVYGQKRERNCYKCDIVYGSISNFQFDYLRHQFQKENTFGKREIHKNWLILDEVDSLIIDQGSNIARLSNPFPGMQSLRYVYLNIWLQMAKCQNKLYKKIEQKLGMILQNKDLKQIIQIFEKQNQDDTNFINNFYEELKKQMLEQKDRIVNKDLIAMNIHHFVEKRLQTWIQNAYLAKYKYRQNNEYKLVQKERQLEIIPVDNKNTGASMKNTILSNGIHQFLQLKHNLFLTYQSLTSCFISNVAYIKFYNSNISGLTGTLGSQAQISLLHSIYKIDFFFMPTYIKKRFIEYPGVIVRKDEINQSISQAALKQVIQKQENKPRAVLIICQTIENALQLQISLQIKMANTNIQNIEIKLFTDENEADITKQKVGPGVIIIATNISGRGTDYKTTQQLQQNGGLHIIISFLPCNKRVQDQALGRTSRQGKSGSAQLIISKSDIQKYGLNQFVGFDYLKRIRDNEESERLQHMRNIRLPQINFQDEIFNKFCNIYSKLKQKNKNKFQWTYYLMDLKQRWAFWLVQKSYNKEIIQNTDVQKQYNEFNQVSKQIIEGQVCWNPYYSILVIDKYLSMDKKKQAGIQIDRIIATFHNLEFYYPLFMKCFQLQIMNGNQFRQKCRKALGKLIFYNVQKKQQYKDSAHSYLQKAEKGISVQINYLDSIITNKEIFHYIILENNNKHRDKQQNILLKHLTGRSLALKIFLKTIQTSKSQLKGSNALKQGISILSKVPRSLRQLSKSDQDQKNIAKYVSQRQVNQLQFIGMDSIVLLKQIHDVPNEIVIWAQYQIAAGLSLLALCVPFPFLLPVKAPLANVLIYEGITDIVMALINQGQAGFDQSDYIKSKVISYGVPCLTVGINLWLSLSQILQNVQSICQKLASKLRSAKNFKTICNWLAKVLQLLVQTIEIMIVKIKILKGIDQTSQIKKFKVTKNITRYLELQKFVYKTTNFNKLTKLGKFGKDCTIHIIPTVSNIAISIASRKVMCLTLFKIIDCYQKQFLKKVKNTIKQLIEKNKTELSLMSEKQVDYRFETILPMDLQKRVFKEIFDRIKSGMDWKIELVVFLIDSGSSIKQLKQYIQKRFNQFFRIQVSQQINNIVKKCNLQQIEERLSNMITIQLMNYLKTMLAKVITTSIMIGYKYIQQQKQFDKINRYIEYQQREIENTEINATGKKVDRQSQEKIIATDIQENLGFSNIEIPGKDAMIQETKQIQNAICMNNSRIDNYSEDNTQTIATQMKSGESQTSKIENLMRYQHRAFKHANNQFINLQINNQIPNNKMQIPKDQTYTSNMQNYESNIIKEGSALQNNVSQQVQPKIV